MNKIGIKTMEEMERVFEILANEAKQASEMANPHISGFRVGAAILSKERNIYRGCNIEFDNFSNTLHAEEVALANMFIHGEQEFDFIAVHTNDNKLWFPCGMCLQSLHEKGGPKLNVIACNNEKAEMKKLEELMPYGYKGVANDK